MVEGNIIMLRKLYYIFNTHNLLKPATIAGGTRKVL